MFIQHTRGEMRGLLITEIDVFIYNTKISVFNLNILGNLI